MIVQLTRGYIAQIDECDSQIVCERRWCALAAAGGHLYAISYSSGGGKAKSGMQDKSIAIETGIDPAILSKAKTGQARLSERDLDALMDVTGYEAPLTARLLRRNKDPRSLRKLETETERELREANEALEAERVKVRVLTEALRGNTP